MLMIIVRILIANNLQSHHASAACAIRRWTMLCALSGWYSLSPLAKERAQQRAGAALVDAAVDLRSMMAGRLSENARAVLDAPGFRVIGAKIEAADARQRNRRRAHRAGLQRYVQVAIVELLAAEGSRAGAQHEHLGMRCRVAIGFDPVAAGGDDRTVRAQQDRADRDFAEPTGLLGRLKGQRH